LILIHDFSWLKSRRDAHWSTRRPVENACINANAHLEFLFRARHERFGILFVITHDDDYKRGD
jgi:hypothetical protein